MSYVYLVMTDWYADNPYPAAVFDSSGAARDFVDSKGVPRSQGEELRVVRMEMNSSVYTELPTIYEGPKAKARVTSSP
jgi:hypothetical protein